ncbi:unnamed protein product [Meganyctiphanes norvegica]|uniref:C-type lectin domain-containing protein n=1 Tax=Meganyctiphanes norvegica TaxID=48144 RepID=A0AAV2SDH0_MEGNR
MLDYSQQEDQALLVAATSKNKDFWVGGKSEDGAHWAWLDGRDIYLLAQFWYYTEPDELNNKCATTQVTTSGTNVRSYLYDSDCSESSYFICQTGFHLDFRRIGNHYYFISEELNLGYHSWQDARDYCMSLSVPSGYHADLAVLGLDKDDYHLINTLVNGYTATTWIGSLREGEACTYTWTDGRALGTDSLLWLFNQPGCGSFNRVYIFKNTYSNRTALSDQIETLEMAFICQLYLDP